MPAAPCSSEILPFPTRPDDRLRHALRQLDLALAEQRQAVAGLRGELARLGEAVCGLDDSLGQFRGALGSTAAELARAGQEAQRLEATASAMLALSPD
jgi:hypothetical protein